MIWYRKWGGLILLFALLVACNKDDVIEDEIPQLPVISFENENNIFTAKVNREIVITPTVEYAPNPRFSWYSGTRLVGVEASFRKTYHQTGEEFLRLVVDSDKGSAEEELKIEIVELTPPQISLALPTQGLKVMAGTDYELKPEIKFREEEFQISWWVNGEEVSSEESYVFNRQELGVYEVVIKAENRDGKTETEFKIEVVEQYPYKVAFEKVFYEQERAERTSITHRKVCLEPSLEYFERPRFRWFINGEQQTSEERMLVFMPTEKGTYDVRVEVREGGAEKEALTRHITRGETMVEGKITVHVLASSEVQGIRSKTAQSSKIQERVYEYCPAPGQFINETKTAGFSGTETSMAAANAYAMRRLEEGVGNPNSNGTYVSLGGFGGYIIVGFDHSIVKGNGEEFDFDITGNAFDGSSEPGVVWVMQDLNGNGLPDEEWYELRGSETGKDGTIQNYAVTYFRPWGRGMDVQWQDSEGKRGAIDYLMSFHPQDYYYPAWIEEDSYTLRGTLLTPRNQMDPSSGFWANKAYDWGYADNYGNDQLKGGDQETGSGQRNGFYLKNAMTADLEAINLEYIDFVKVQVGVNAKSGPLGEISTEVFGFSDSSMK